MQNNRSGWREHTLQATNNHGIRTWLTDPGSLTWRLQTLGSISVKLLNQGLAHPTADEAAELGLKHTHLAWTREVALLVDDRPMVFAHTILPRRPRGPLIRWLERLGNRSLGALLFAHPGFQRGRLAARRLDRRHTLFQSAANALQITDKPHRELWARRSRFTFGAQSILVTEIFSPEVSKFRSTRND